MNKYIVSRELYEALEYDLTPEERARKLGQAQWDLRIGGINASTEELEKAFKESKTKGTQPINELLKAKGYTGIIPSKEFQNTGYGSVAYMDQPGMIPLDTEHKFTEKELERKRVLEKEHHERGAQKVAERMTMPLKDAEKVIFGPFAEFGNEYRKPGAVMIVHNPEVRQQFGDINELDDATKEKAIPMMEYMKEHEPETYNVGMALKNFEEIPLHDIPIKDIGKSREGLDLIDTRRYKFGTTEWQTAMEHNINTKLVNNEELEPGENAFIKHENEKDNLDIIWKPVLKKQEDD